MRASGTEIHSIVPLGFSCQAEVFEEKESDLSHSDQSHLLVMSSHGDERRGGHRK